MTRENESAIHRLVVKPDGSVEVIEDTPRFVCEPYEPEDEDEPEVGPSFEPGTATRTAVIRLGGG